MSIRLGIVDDHLVLRQGLVSLIREFGQGISILFDVGNGLELLEKLLHSRPDIILLDLEMPLMDGSEALEQTLLFYPEIKVIILSMHDQEEYVNELTRKGAKAFLPKGINIEKLIDVIETVHIVGSYHETEPSTITPQKKPFGRFFDSLLPNKFGLTRRELEIIKLLQENKTTSEIADMLNISNRTVEGHRKSFMLKTNSKNLAALIAKLHGAK